MLTLATSRLFCSFITSMMSPVSTSMHDWSAPRPVIRDSRYWSRSVRRSCSAPSRMRTCMVLLAGLAESLSRDIHLTSRMRSSAVTVTVFMRSSFRGGVQFLDERDFLGVISLNP